MGIRGPHVHLWPRRHKPGATQPLKPRAQEEAPPQPRRWIHGHCHSGVQGAPPVADQLCHLVNEEEHPHPCRPPGHRDDPGAPQEWWDRSAFLGGVYAALWRLQTGEDLEEVA